MQLIWQKWRLSCKSAGCQTIASANIAALELKVVPFDDDLPINAGLLRAATRSAGLSLGGRACLALAQSLKATALTNDRAWDNLEIGIAIELAR